MLEIELKAWADDLDAVRRRLVALGKPALHDGRAVVKEDVYFCPVGADVARLDQTRDRLLRVRVQDGVALLTAKRKKIEGGVETSDEIEVEVKDDGTQLRRLADYLGYRPFLEKRKESLAFEWTPGTTVELNRLAGLGDFVEIEALVADQADVAAARERVQRVLAELGVPAARIEARPYMDLYRERAR